MEGKLVYQKAVLEQVRLVEVQYASSTGEER